MDVRRGDVIKYVNTKNDSERYGVIVSGDEYNKEFDFVNIVMITKFASEERYTHTDVIVKTPSTALCEKIVCVSKDQIIDIIRTCKDEEMNRISERLMYAVGVEDFIVYESTPKYVDEIALEQELKIVKSDLKEMCEDRDRVYRKLEDTGNELEKVLNERSDAEEKVFELKRYIKELETKSSTIMPAASKHELELEAVLRDANDTINDLRNRIGYHEQEIENERKKTKKYKSLYEFAVKKLMEDE